MCAAVYVHAFMLRMQFNVYTLLDLCRTSEQAGPQLEKLMEPILVRVCRRLCVLQVVEFPCCSLVQAPVVDPRVQADGVAVLLQALSTFNVVIFEDLVKMNAV